MFREGGAAIAARALGSNERRGASLLAKVEIYTKDWCGYCARAKRLLAEIGADTVAYPVDMDRDKKAEMIQRAGGRTTVPQIFIDGTHIGGCDDLMALERSGKLAAMLAA